MCRCEPRRFGGVATNRPREQTNYSRELIACVGARSARADSRDRNFLFVTGSHAGRDQRSRGPHAAPLGWKNLYVLTFDIEDWFHILEHEPTRAVQSWHRFESRVRWGTDRILELLDRHNVRATFFCLGWVAARDPSLVRAIAAAGHEVGTHSFAHEMVHQQSPRAFEADLERSIGTISDALGSKVASYRAPGFSITPRTPWAFETLVRHGIETDASLFPTWRMHGGFPGAIRQPGWIETPAGRIREFPMSVSSLAGRHVPVSGGGYFRLFPTSLTHALMRREPYVMTYFHPRDFDVGQPTIPGLSLLRHVRTYVGVGSAFARFEQMLSAFDFTDFREASERIDWRRAPTMRPIEEDGRTRWEVVRGSDHPPVTRPDAASQGLRLDLGQTATGVSEGESSNR